MLYILLSEYLLELTNEISGDVDVLKNIYPNVVVEKNMIVIHKNLILKNDDFKRQYKNINLKGFYGFAFTTNKNGKITNSGFYRPELVTRQVNK